MCGVDDKKSRKRRRGRMGGGNGNREDDGKLIGAGRQAVLGCGRPD